MNRATILSVLRILVGILFFVEVVTKLPDWLVSGAPLADILNLFVAQSVPLYAGFLRYVVLPNASTFALLVVIAELAASFSLILGVLPRVGAGLAVWLTLNYMLMRGGPGPQSATDVTVCAIAFALVLQADRLRWRLDRRLAHRAPIALGSRV